MLHGVFFSQAQSIPVLHLAEIRWLKHSWFYFMGYYKMNILKQNSVIMNIQYKMSLHWGKCHCLGTSSDLSNIRFITLHLRWSSSVVLSQMYQHLCSPCIAIKMRTMFTTSPLANWMPPTEPVSLWKVLFHLCLLSTYLWCLGNLYSGFAVKFGSMGEVRATSLCFCTASWRATPVPRFWDPSHTAPLWRPQLAALPLVPPTSPQAPTCSGGECLLL